MGNGVWLHGPEEAACYVPQEYGLDGEISYTQITLSWAEPGARVVAEAVQKRLEALDARLDWPAHVADGYESFEAYLRLPTQFEP